MAVLVNIDEAQWKAMLHAKVTFGAKGYATSSGSLGRINWGRLPRGGMLKREQMLALDALMAERRQAVGPQYMPLASRSDVEFVFVREGGYVYSQALKGLGHLKIKPASSFSEGDVAITEEEFAAL